MPNLEIARPSWTRQAASACGVFALLGFAVAGVVFAGAPRWWTGTATAAVAAGLGGASAWPLVCGRTARPPWWRAGVAGAVAGVLLHPYYWLLAGVGSGEVPTLAMVVEGSLLSLLVVGVITVPAGAAAGLCWRAAAFVRRGRTTEPGAAPAPGSR
jgi:hypothetical protein